MDLQLTVPKSRFKFWCDRSFPKATAVKWNALPLTIKKAPSLAVFKKCTLDLDVRKSIPFNGCYNDFIKLNYICIIFDPLTF